MDIGDINIYNIERVSLPIFEREVIELSCYDNKVCVEGLIDFNSLELFRSASDDSSEGETEKKYGKYDGMSLTFSGSEEEFIRVRRALNYLIEKVLLEDRKNDPFGY